MLLNSHLISSFCLTYIFIHSSSFGAVIINGINASPWFQFSGSLLLYLRFLLRTRVRTSSDINNVTGAVLKYLITNFIDAFGRLKGQSVQPPSYLVRYFEYHLTFYCKNIVTGQQGRTCVTITGCVGSFGYLNQLL